VTSLLVLVPMRIEQLALGSRPGWTTIRSGMGPDRARIAAARGLAVEAPAVAVAGVCAAAAPGIRAGDVVVATEVRRDGAEPVETPAGARLLDALRRCGLTVHAGPVFSTRRLARTDERDHLGAAGLLAVDMESAWLAAAAGGRPLAVVRVVVEPAGRRLADPRTLAAGTRALAHLRRATTPLDEWAREAAALDGSLPQPDKVPLVGQFEQRGREA
jgi:4-hydroxy-3-methylbut-2-en-1-yl diphosphate reductase